MKTKLIAVALLLATLLGVCGCAGVSALATEDGAAAAQDPNFISAEDKALLSTETASDDFINLAAVDEEDEPLYQIVYNAQDGLRVKEQCETLAASINDVTGVEIPVKDSNRASASNQYEILVGGINRVETIDKVQSYDLGESDFVICVIGKRLVIYADTDYALVSGMIYFIETAAKKDALEKMYGIASDYEFLYHPDDTPTVEASKSEDGYYVNLTLTNGPSMYTYARVSYTGNKGWRLQTKFRKEDSFKDAGAAQVLAYSMGEYELGTEDDRFYKEKITVTQTGDKCTVTGPEGAGKIVINTAAFQMDFYTESGKLATTITNINHNAGGSSITGKFEDKKVGGETVKEAVFGTGERMNGANQRGKKIEMFSKDIWSKAEACYMVIPLLSFSRGSGIFFNIYEHMVLDLGSDLRKAPDKWTSYVTGAGIDCYIYTTEEIEDVIHNYSRLTGYAGMPEEWTYGMIVCAYGPDLSQKWTTSIKPSYSEGKGDGRGEGVYNMIANMEANDLPWTGVLAEGWGGYTESKHQDLKELCDYVHSLGKKFLVYMRVGSASAGMSGYSAGYLLTQTRADGTVSSNLPDTTADTNNPDVGTGAGRSHVYVDISNPQATAWFFDEYWDYLSNEIGVDGCKIDFCETLPENYKLNYFDENIPTAGSHHWYPSAFCAMFFDMISSKPDSGMCYTRGGGIGAQRAPFMWAGDQQRSWNGIQYQLSAAITSGLSGVPFMSYDMSGYQYGNEKLCKDIDYEAEVFLRGTQYSAFTVCIQTHGKVLRSYQFMGLERPVMDTDGDGGKPLLDKDGNVVKDDDGNVVYETKVYVPEGYEYVTQIYRAYTKLHEHLTPYITELSEKAVATGLPVMRHLVLGWQDDHEVYDISDEFMLGDAFLVAPVFEEMGKMEGEDYQPDKSVTARKVYLPALEGGAKWLCLETGDEYEGGQEYTISDITIADLPTFYNPTTESETAKALVEGIMEIYDYAKTFEPAA